MAQELEEQTKQETPALQQAVRLIASHPELRLFIRRYLSSCGLLPLASPFSADPLEMARRSGHIQAGLNLLEMLNAVDPLLWPALQIEDGQQ